MAQAHSAGQSSNRMHCMHLIQYFNSFSHSLFISDTTMVYFHTFCQIDFRFVHSWLLFRSFACQSLCLRQRFVLIFAFNVCWMSSACISLFLAEAQHFRALEESFLQSHASLSIPTFLFWTRCHRLIVDNLSSILFEYLKKLRNEYSDLKLKILFVNGMSSFRW